MFAQQNDNQTASVSHPPSAWPNAGRQQDAKVPAIGDDAEYLNVWYGYLGGNGWGEFLEVECMCFCLPWQTIRVLQQQQEHHRWANARGIYVYEYP